MHHGRPYVTEELLEGGTGPSLWDRGWNALPPRARAVLGIVIVAVLLAAGLVWWRELGAERELRQRVVLTSSMAVTSSSTSPPGGAVRWLLTVRNHGARPVSVTAVDGGDARLRLSAADGSARRIGPGQAVDVPLSVRLTCAAAPGRGLRADIGVRREDGGDVRRGVDVAGAFLVVDAADTLCTVRPSLRDHELSGPVVAVRPAG